jgi:hypothetical protein
MSSAAAALTKGAAKLVPDPDLVAVQTRAHDLLARR